jgi:hypothetical protein
MGEKISGYPVSATALESGDLLDVSKEISTFPSVYESQKAPASLLADWNLFGQDNQTMAAPRGHNLGNNQFSFFNGRFLLKGSDDVATDLLTLENLSGNDILKVQNDGSISSEININWNLNSNNLTFSGGGVGVLGLVNVAASAALLPSVFGVQDNALGWLFNVSEEGGVSIGDLTADSKSILDIQSTTKGVLLPRLTSVQRDAIVAPTTSLLLFNTTSNEYEYYNGGAWSGVGSNIMNKNGLTLLGNYSHDLDGNVLTFTTGFGNLTIDGTGASSQDVFTINGVSGGTSNFNNSAGLELSSKADHHLSMVDQVFGWGEIFNASTGLGGFWKGTLEIGGSPTLTGLKITNSRDYEFNNNANLRDVFFDLDLGTKQVLLLEQGYTRANSSIVLGGSASVGNEDVTIYGDVLFNAGISSPNLGVYADDVAAGVGGLVQGDQYQTATGEMRIKL